MVIVTIFKKYWENGCYKVILPLFWIIARILPRRLDIWVYGEGHTSAASPLLRYAKQKDTRKHIYITPYESQIKIMRDDGVLAFKPSSVIGCYYISRAKVHVITKTRLEDLNTYLSYNALIVNLWHCITSDLFENSTTNKPQWKIDRNKARVKKKYERYYFLCSTSKFTQKLQAQYFGIDLLKLPVVGMPKLDMLYSQRESKANNTSLLSNEFDMVFAYMPSSRRQGELVWDHEIDFEKMNDFLVKNNSALILRPHYRDRSSFNLDKDYSNILLTSSHYSQEWTDVNDTLVGVDVLISDYSSLIYEFLITGKPILIYTPDYTSYSTESYCVLHQTIEDFDHKIPSNRNNNLDELLVSMESVINKSYSYKKYNETLEKYHFYQDGDSSRRVYEHITKRIDKI